MGLKILLLKILLKKGNVVTEITIPNATDETKTLKLVLSDSVNTLVDSSEVTDNYSPQITLKDIPSAPIAKGKVLGTATYIVNDKSYVVNLIASNDVTLSTSRTYYLQVCLLVLVVAVLIILLFFWKTDKKIKNDIDISDSN